MQALIDRVITCEATARGTGFSTLLQPREIHGHRLAGRVCGLEVVGECVDGGWGMRWVCGWQRNSVDYVFFWGL